jgi:hypothetical protein
MVTSLLLLLSYYYCDELNPLASSYDLPNDDWHPRMCCDELAPSYDLVNTAMNWHPDGNTVMNWHPRMIWLIVYCDQLAS